MIFDFIKKTRIESGEREVNALKEYQEFCVALRNEVSLSDATKNKLCLMYWCKNKMEFRLLEVEKKLFRLENKICLAHGFIVALIIFIFCWYCGVIV